MSGQQVDVLAVLRRDADHASIHRCTKAFSLTEIGRFARESDDAIAAVAELVEAGAEYHAAELAWAEDDIGAKKVLTRLGVARERFEAALARVQGGEA